jgi:hypothetical protein
MLWRKKMPAIMQYKALLTIDLLLNAAASKPLSPDLNLIGETPVQSDSRAPELTGNWQKRENTEHRDIDEDLEIHELMEDIKRYIRSIDISSL